jgi:hypothetical protein
LHPAPPSFPLSQILIGSLSASDLQKRRYFLPLSAKTAIFATLFIKKLADK